MTALNGFLSGNLGEVAPRSYLLGDNNAPVALCISRIMCAIAQNGMAPWATGFLACACLCINEELPEWGA